MARYRVQLKSYFKHPDPKMRIFDHIVTNDDIRNEINSGRNIVNVKSAATNLQYHLPVDIIAYVADISTLGSGR
jgi:hypothetical protein